MRALYGEEIGRGCCCIEETPWSFVTLTSLLMCRCPCLQDVRVFQIFVQTRQYVVSSDAEVISPRRRIQV